MRHALAVAAVAVAIGLPGTQIVAAQDTKTARGLVRATAPAAVTIHQRGSSNEMTFKVDSATLVTARGGSTAMRHALANGQTGVPYTDIVLIGQSVEVTYREAGMHAATIKVVPGGPEQANVRAAPAASAPRALNIVGVVTAVSNTLLTIKGDSGDLTYAINGKTKVFGPGLGTQARASKRAGERTLFSQFVHMGDTVQVRYEETSEVKHALEVHVTSKSN
jgi:hypothetical protein